jgi:hypothetical protein
MLLIAFKKNIIFYAGNKFEGHRGVKIRKEQT